MLFILFHVAWFVLGVCAFALWLYTRRYAKYGVHLLEAILAFVFFSALGGVGLFGMLVYIAYQQWGDFYVIKPYWDRSSSEDDD